MDEVRTYLTVVPENIKEQLSANWGSRKKETFLAAEKLGLKIEEDDSFNKVVKFILESGYYHLSSNVISVRDVSNRDEVRSKVSETINNMVKLEKAMQCIPLVASNICDWDSAYAKAVGANVELRDSLINTCIANNILLTGGETANLGDQLRKTGMSWMFTLLSKYTGLSVPMTYKTPYNSVMDSALQETFQYIADDKKFTICNFNGIPLLFVKERSKFIMTADGAGSKSIVCEMVNKRTDIEDALAMAGDDPPRDGAFPIFASIGIHAEHLEGKDQILRNMIIAGKKNAIPMVGSIFHASSDVYTYTMNGVILSEVRAEHSILGKAESGLDLILLYEEQRSNGITLQRRVLEEAFGPKWYAVKVSAAISHLDQMLKGKYPHIPSFSTGETLGELVSRPSTPYFRVDSLMPKNLLDTIKFRVNVSSGGIIGKTRRSLERFRLGADYFDPFDAPPLTLIIQMASRIDGSKGIIPDEVAYYTWGCGNGAIIGTTHPDLVVDYYNKSGISAKAGGKIISAPEIRIRSKAFDSMQKTEPYILTHKYTDLPLG